MIDETFDLDRARRTTPARLAVGRAGQRPPTHEWLSFQRDHAVAQDAVWSVWSSAFLERLGGLGFEFARSAAPDRRAYIQQPPLGRELPEAELARISGRCRHDPTIQLVLSDGLSALAAETHFERLYPALLRHLERIGVVGTPVAVTNGRVAVADPIGAALGAQMIVHFIGERPGLGTADSLGCYLTFQPGPATTDADRKCVSNIRAAGLPPDEAGATVAGICRKILDARSSGTDLHL